MGVPSIPLTTVLMAGTRNTLIDGVMIYNALTGTYIEQFPNGAGEFDPVNFQLPEAFASSSSEVFVGCYGYFSSSQPGVPKIMVFDLANYSYNVLTWLPSDFYFVPNSLCFAGGFLYLLTPTGAVWRFIASSGSPAGLTGNSTDATFLPTGSVALPNVNYGGLACSPQFIGGNLYISSGTEILVVDGSNGQQLNTIQYAGFQQPSTLAFNGSGMLYVYDSGSVLLFNGATGQTVGSSGSGSGNAMLIPAGTAGMTPSGGLCVFDWAGGTAVYLTVFPMAPVAGPGSVWQFDGTTGAFDQIIVPSGSGGLNQPVSVTTGVVGSNLWEPIVPPPPLPPRPRPFPPWRRKPISVPTPWFRT